MDYVTKPTSRLAMRNIATVFRELFHLSCKKCVPVIELLDKFCKELGNVTYEVVEDSELQGNIPAITEIASDGWFTIKIKESVYEGALYREVGGYRNHIMHEMCHVMLYKLGFTPILERSFANNKIPPAYSAEWQAMALCGEIMMPYNETQNMTDRIYGIQDKDGNPKQIGIYKDNHLITTIDFPDKHKDYIHANDWGSKGYDKYGAISVRISERRNLSDYEKDLVNSFVKNKHIGE